MLSAGLILAISALSFAQEVTESASPQRTAKEIYRELWDEEMQAQQVFGDELAAWVEARNKLADPSQAPPPPDQPWVQFGPRWIAAAERYAGTGDAVGFLCRIAQTEFFLGGDKGEWALQTLLEEHLAHPDLAALCSFLPKAEGYLGKERGRAVVAKIEAATPSERLRAWAVYTRGIEVLRSTEPSSEAFLKMKSEIIAAVEKGHASGVTQELNKELAILEAFGFGLTAPDIAGPDLDGNEFKLGDYKGKIIFLDFWGDW